MATEGAINEGKLPIVKTIVISADEISTNVWDLETQFEQGLDSLDATVLRLIEAALVQSKRRVRFGKGRT